MRRRRICMLLRGLDIDFFFSLFSFFLFLSFFVSIPFDYAYGWYAKI